MRLITTVSIFTLLLLPLVTGAADGPKFETLQQLPGFANTGDLELREYIQLLFDAAIGVAALLAVLRLIMAGVEYMFSEVVTSKEAAKKKIFGAIFGLLIILATTTLLNTINPNLTNLDILNLDAYKSNLVPAKKTFDTQCSNGNLVLSGGEYSCSEGSRSDTTVKNKSEVGEDFFSGPVTISATIDKDLREDPYFNQNGITKDNFTEKVAGVREVDSSFADQEGGVDVFAETIVRPACASQKIHRSQSSSIRGSNSYVFYCLE